jgi:ElaA protein
MVPSPIWHWRSFDRLSPVELYAILRARAEVFIIEQACAFLDLDGLDAHARHLLGWSSDVEPGALVAYLRLVEPGRKYVEPSIGRVLTTAPFRRRGYGRALMQAGLQEAARAYPGRDLRIGAQQRLEHFYVSLGFRTVSAPYVEDGIDHVEMLMSPAPMR